MIQIIMSENVDIHMEIKFTCEFVKHKDARAKNIREMRIEKWGLNRLK